MLQFRMTKRIGLTISFIIWVTASLILVNLYLGSPTINDCNCEVGENHYTEVEYILFSFINPISIVYWVLIWLMYLYRHSWKQLFIGLMYQLKKIVIWLFSKEEC